MIRLMPLTVQEKWGLIAIAIFFLLIFISCVIGACCAIPSNEE
jgi:hypothetical protein